MEKTLVFLTVDTEVWPWTPNWRDSRLSKDMERDLYGITSEGEFGLRFQIKVLNAHALKAVFFVESLFANAVGLEPLRETVELIQEQGQDVQVHVHPEWLAYASRSTHHTKVTENMKDFSQNEQVSIISQAIRNLRSCGAQHLCAFRAGNYGANWKTLSALTQNNILYDTSYNPCYLAGC